MNTLLNIQGNIRSLDMDRKEILQQLRGKLVVSCQAYEDNPLYGVDNMVTMAKCVLKGGAEGLRVCWPQTAIEVRKFCKAPIIGINKIMDPLNFDMYSSVFITPTYQSAVEMIEAGCDIIALDGTMRKRPNGEKLADIVQRIKGNYPHILLMADLATVEEGIACAAMGVDILSSTLSGYTEETKGKSELEPDYQLIKELKEKTNCFINGEGRIWNLEQLNTVWNSGADMVTIGSSITNPMKTTKYLIKNMKSGRGWSYVNKI